MKKNGFTLIEVLGVITLLALLSVIVIVSISKSLKDSIKTLSEAQIESIKSAAAMWRTDHIELIPDNDYYMLSLSELQGGGYISDDIIDLEKDSSYAEDLVLEVGLNDVIFNDSLVKNGYKKLEYIESTGTQYIDTGVVANENTSIEVDGYSSSNISLYGSQWKINGTGYSTDTIRMKFVYFSRMYDSKILINERHRFKQKKNEVYVDDNLIYTFAESSSENNYPMYLFGRSSVEDGSLNDYGSGRIYYSKIWDGDNLIRHFIPCIRKNDGKTGLYDLIENKFYVNSNNDNKEFEYNKEFNDKYQRLEYVESTGNQYIKTLVVPNLDTSIEVDGYTSSNKSLYGSQLIMNGTGYTSSSSIYMRFTYFGNTFDSNVLINQRHKFMQKKNELYVDNNLIYTYGNPTMESKYQMFLFGRSALNNGSLNDYGSGKIYGVKIWNGDVLIRNMKPYLRKSDNVAGLYDFVNGIFYTNAGVGSLGYKIPKEASWENLYTELDYISTNGTQYINLGYKAKTNTEVRLDVQFVPNINTYVASSTGNGIIGREVTVDTNNFSINFGANADQYNHIFYWIDKTYASGAEVKKNIYDSVLSRSVMIAKSDSATFQGVTHEVATKTANNTENMLLFGNFDSSTNEISSFKRYDTKIYGFQIYEGNALVSDMIPCKRNSDNAIGLYDEVNDVFYTNSGTGTFGYGELN